MREAELTDAVLNRPHEGVGDTRGGSGGVGRDHYLNVLMKGGGRGGGRGRLRYEDWY